MERCRIAFVPTYSLIPSLQVRKVVGGKKGITRDSVAREWVASCHGRKKKFIYLPDTSFSARGDYPTEYKLLREPTNNLQTSLRGDGP